jgi:hypothetical protein
VEQILRLIRENFSLPNAQDAAKKDCERTMAVLGRILIVEHDPNDVELTLTALADYNLANEIVITGDGQQALDYLYCRGAHHRQSSVHAARFKTAEGRWIEGLAVDRVRPAEYDTVVVLTSSEEKDVMRSYSLGVNAYVAKPDDICDLSTR